MIDNRIKETNNYLNVSWVIYNAINKPMIDRMSNYDKISLLKGGLIDPCSSDYETSLKSTHFKIMKSILSRFSSEANTTDVLSPEDIIYMAEVCNQMSKNKEL